MKPILPLEIFTSNQPQTTVAGRVLLAGVSVASGQPCQGFVFPASADHGLVFEIDGRLIPARHEFLLHDGPSRITAPCGQLSPSISPYFNKKLKT